MKGAGYSQPGVIDVSTERLRAPVKVIKVMRSLALSQQLYVALDLHFFRPQSALEPAQPGLSSADTCKAGMVWNSLQIYMIVICLCVLVCHWDVVFGEFAGSCWYRTVALILLLPDINFCFIGRDNADQPTRVSQWCNSLVLSL